MRIIVVKHRWQEDHHIGLGFIQRNSRARYLFWWARKPFSIGFVGW